MKKYPSVIFRKGQVFVHIAVGNYLILSILLIFEKMSEKSAQTGC